MPGCTFVNNSLISSSGGSASGGGLYLSYRTSVYGGSSVTLSPVSLEGEEAGAGVWGVCVEGYTVLQYKGAWGCPVKEMSCVTGGAGKYDSAPVDLNIRWQAWARGG
jgi:hypothetical protein